MYDVIIEFPKMKVAVTTREERVAEIRYLPPTVNAKAPTTALAERAARQLERYREDPDAHFDLPLAIEGSEFQRRLWDALCTIPRGKTLTYGELAQRLDAEARAIGQAFIAIDPGALAGTNIYLERVETVVRTMTADPEVRLPGARRFAAEKSARAQGIEVPDELLAQIEKLAQ